MSGHLLGALQMEEALRTGSPAQVWDEWHAPDLYPPAHSGVFGIWFLLFGSGPVACLACCALIYLLTLAWLARVDLSGAAFFASLILVSALAPTLMVEPVAVLFLVAALVIGGRCISDPTRGNVVATACLITATLLTKYNVGLPLLVVLPLSSLLTRRWRLVATCTGIALSAALVGLAFLSFQESGWDLFLRFAKNRSNAADLSLLERAGWYLEIARTHFVGTFVALVVAAALAGWGVWKRSPIATFASLYFFVSLAALVRHDYLLSRNLVGPMAALAVAVAAGARSLPRRRESWLLRLGAVAVFAVGAWLGLPVRAQLAGNLQGPVDPDLDVVTQILREGMNGPGEVRVVGTFEQFGSGWVKIVGLQLPTPLVVRVDWPYPVALGPDRAGRSTNWHPEYARTLQNWASHGEPRVITFTVEDTSPYHGSGHAKWTQWKDNYAAGIPWTGWYSVKREQRLSDGVQVTVFERLLACLEFGSGWGPLEGWGRWADASEATITVPPLERPLRLEFEVAVAENFESGQRIELWMDGTRVNEVGLGAMPWRWAASAVELGTSPESRELIFAFDQWESDAKGRSFAAAFRRMVLREVEVVVARSRSQ